MSLARYIIQRKIVNLLILSKKNIRRFSVNAVCCNTKKLAFSAEGDRFNGLTVDTIEIKYDAQEFLVLLEDSLTQWRNEGKRCIWFKIRIGNSDFVPLLAKKGFNFHHARDDFVMMYKWLPVDSEPNLPPSCHTNLGVGALVLNGKSQLLAISEKNYDYPHWKLPGGYVERGEDIKDAAVREVKEETGVESSFESIITFRHTHNMMYGNSDIYILMMMKAVTEHIVQSEREVRHCKWMDIEEYINHPHVHKFNRAVVKTALKYQEKNFKLDIKTKTVTWPTATRVMNYLVASGFEV